MFIYKGFIKLTYTVSDFEEAQSYLEDENMVMFLRNDLSRKNYRDTIERMGNLSIITWQLKEDNPLICEIIFCSENEMTDQDLERIEKWIKEENSDGIGSGFEQQDFARYFDNNESKWVLSRFIRESFQNLRVE